MKKCANWCGGGCTQKQFDVATSTAEEVAAKLGEGWKPRVWENLGWHFAVESPSRTIQVYGSGNHFTALIHPPGGSGGQTGLTGQGDTARAAVEDTVALTRKEIAKLERWLDGVN